MKNNKKIIETWKPIALGCMFILSGLSNIYIALFQGVAGLIPSLEDPMILQGLNAIVLLFSFVFFGVAWGFFKRKLWSYKWGIGTGIVMFSFSLLSINIFGIIYWGFVIYLSHTSAKELNNL